MSDIYETFDYGYDTSVPEDVVARDVPPPAAGLPPSHGVLTKYLPPVGKQTMPNCFVWATAYGIANCWAAQTGDYSPTAPGQLASPDYTYIQVELENGVETNTCDGGKMDPVLKFLINNGGTASLESAPNHSGPPSSSSCEENWNAYGSGSISPDASFKIPGRRWTTVTGPNGLNNMRSVIASGVPLAYGTWLYTDFPDYDGTPSPYVGNCKWLINKKTNKKVGHCMMIIAYDDNFLGSDGAVLIQNSFGQSWGSAMPDGWGILGQGFVWMAYSTFQATAQDNSAVYISNG
jgi:hypothetical protein